MKLRFRYSPTSLQYSFKILVCLIFAFSNSFAQSDTELRVLKVDGHEKDIRRVFHNFSGEDYLNAAVIRFDSSFSKMYLSANKDVRLSYNLVRELGLIHVFSRDTTWRLGMLNPSRTQYRMKIVFDDNNRVTIRLSNSKLKINRLSKPVTIYAELVSGSLKEYLTTAPSVKQ